MEGINIIVLNLKRASERKDNIIRQFKKLGINNYSFFDAIDGKFETREKLISIFDELGISNYSFIDDSNKLDIKITPGHISAGRRMENGEIACTLSTIKMIKYAKKHNWETTLFLEDDVILCDDFIAKLNKIIKLTPKNWEHIYLSGHIYNKLPPIIKPSVIQTNFKVSGSYSYLLNINSYDKVIKKLSTLVTTTDDIIEEMYLKDKNLKSYICFPFLTYPNVNDSYIWDKFGGRNTHASKKYFDQ